MVTASQKIDRLQVVADDDALVAGAGLLLPATLCDRLGLAGLLDERVTAGPNPAGKCLTVLASALLGGDCIDDVDVLRAGSTRHVLGHRVAAPSTTGTFLRSFTHGHARQLDAVGRQLLVRAAGLGALDLSGPQVVDVDATLVQTFGLAKSGARQVMRTGRRGYHPVVAVLAGGGDVIHSRLRRGRTNDASGAPSFVAETLSRLREAGAEGPVLLRADTGFYLRGVVEACQRADVRFSIGGRMQVGMRRAVQALPEQAWTPIPYFEDGAAVTELDWQCFGDKRKPSSGIGVRLVVRRTPVPPGLRERRGQDELFAAFDYHPIITDQPGEVDTLTVDQVHREHAEVELAIRRPQARRRAQPPAVRTLGRQRRLARAADLRAQPGSLDRPARPPRRHPPPDPQDAADPGPHRPRPAVDPRPAHHAAPAPRLARRRPAARRARPAARPGPPRLTCGHRPDDPRTRNPGPAGAPARPHPARTAHPSDPKDDQSAAASAGGFRLSPAGARRRVPGAGRPSAPGPTTRGRP